MVAISIIVLFTAAVLPYFDLRATRRQLEQGVLETKVVILEARTLAMAPPTKYASQGYVRYGAKFVQGQAPKLVGIKEDGTEDELSGGERPFLVNELETSSVTVIFEVGTAKITNSVSVTVRYGASGPSKTININQEGQIQIQD